MANRSSMAAGVRMFCILLAGVFAVPVAHAGQSNKRAEAELRTIHGMVLDKDENPAPSSIVYLLNRRTQAVRTYIADASASYRFTGLDPNADYEVHAESRDFESAAKTISTYDSRRDVELTLKLVRRKAAK